jgi:hypothetical protein
VWARNHDCVTPEDADCTMEQAMPTSVLGRPDLNLPSGLATVVFDPDHIFRAYQREFKTFSGRFPSFGTAVLAAGGATLEGPKDRPLLIRYRDKPAGVEISAGDVLDLAAQPAGRGTLREMLSGKFVLLGGTYARARDTYETPVGPEAGVDLWAQILATELDRRPLPKPSPDFITLLMLFEGIVLSFTLHLRKPRNAVLWSLAAAAAIAVSGSLYVAHSLGLWPYFVPLIVLVAFLEVYEFLKHRRNEGIQSLVDLGSSRVRQWKARRNGATGARVPEAEAAD